MLRTEQLMRGYARDLDKNVARQIKLKELSATTPRVSLIKCIVEEARLLSFAELYKMVYPKINKVTLYRVLYDLELAGILYQIVTPGLENKYGVKPFEKPSWNAEDYIHFTCESCNCTTCLEGYPIPMMRLPQDYFARRATFAITGICATCKLAGTIQTHSHAALKKCG